MATDQGPMTHLPILAALIQRRQRQITATLALLTLGALGLAPLATLAQETPDRASGRASGPIPERAPVTVGDIDAVMQDKILLDALASRAQARAKLYQADPRASSGAAASMDAAAAPGADSIPALAWRRPTASGWLAKFVYANDAFAVAGLNETLPGGLKVTRIDANQVELTGADGRKISVIPARLAGRAETPGQKTAQTPAGRTPARDQDGFALPPSTPDMQ